MSEKQKIIAKIIALQKKFIAKQHADGGQMDLSDDDAALRDYQKQHEKLATELVDLAHRERGTSR